jgi:hypothetical protein
MMIGKLFKPREVLSPSPLHKSRQYDSLRGPQRHVEPPTDALLPDMHPYHKLHNLRTLVLDLDDVLVTSTWSRGVGWKTFKRPGASDFLDVLSRHYELVVFSNRSHTYVDPILNRIDPGIIRNEGPLIMYRLYKNATVMVVRPCRHKTPSLGPIFDHLAGRFKWSIRSRKFCCFLVPEVARSRAYLRHLAGVLCL